MNDRGHNDEFKSIVATISDCGKSITIDGRAGMGKSCIVNCLLEELEDQNKQI